MAKANLRMIKLKHAKVERLTRELEEAREELRLAVVAAREGGETVAEIARTLGVTRARVYQLLK
jgi:DNA-directed RNA polymerase specialized sigma24 family protein